MGENTRFTSRLPLLSHTPTAETQAHNLTTRIDDTTGRDENVDENRTFSGDMYIVKHVQLWILSTEFVLGLVGGMCVCVWLWHNRRRKSRVNTLILNVAISDLAVICFSTMLQLVWESVGRKWVAGDVVCRLFKFIQVFFMQASVNMLVVLSIDRHQAIRAPLREPIAAWRMAAVGWGVAAALSVPIVGIFRAQYSTEDDSKQFVNITVCASHFHFNPRPPADKQAWITWTSVCNFFIPCIIICVCYVRIFLKISQKVRENRTTGTKHCNKPGKVHLVSSGSNSLPKAKIKTLKMTVAIVVLFIVTTLPIHILGMIHTYASKGVSMSVPEIVNTIMLAVAVSNSAVNPYVFLYFNINVKCLEGVFKRHPGHTHAYYDSMAGSRTEMSHNDTTRTTVKYSGYSAADGVELSVRTTPGTPGSAKAGYAPVPNKLQPIDKKSLVILKREHARDVSVHSPTR